jgi:hypothetical protein
MRSADRSRAVIAASPTASSRDSSTGTVISASARCVSSASSTPFGSNRRARTSVFPRPSASIELSSPHAWKPGAASTTLRPERSGILDR